MPILELTLLKLKLASSRPVYVRELCTHYGPICHHGLKAKSSQHFNATSRNIVTYVENADQTHATFSKPHVNVSVPQAPGARQVDLARMPWGNNVA